jgi:hypothetical protein
MAAQVDTSKPAERDDEHVSQLVRTKIDPAVEDLKARDREFEARHAQEPLWTEGNGGCGNRIRSISYMTHSSGPGNIAASLVTILFPAISAPIGGHFERKRLMNANRWSLLLHLQDLD